jgi:cytoskeletal protein CcmA (bactofilin family)
VVFWGNKDDSAARQTPPKNESERPQGGPTSIGRPSEKPPAEVKPPGDFETLISERYGKIRCAIESGTSISGKVSFDTMVRIDGILKGELYSSSAVVIGPGGLLDVTAAVDTLVVKGRARGKIKAAALIELLPGAEVEAELIAPNLVVAEGACFNGRAVTPTDKVVEFKLPEEKGKN